VLYATECRDGDFFALEVLQSIYRRMREQFPATLVQASNNGDRQTFVNRRNYARPTEHGKV
jgi:hypothetical protein